MIIGGAEDKLRRRTVLQDFVTASGDREARIVVIPTASSIGEEIMAVYDALFRRLGATDVSDVDPASRDEAHDETLVKQLDEIEKRLKRLKIETEQVTADLWNIEEITRVTRDLILANSDCEIAINLASGSTNHSIGMDRACMTFKNRWNLRPFYPFAKKYNGFVYPLQQTEGVKELKIIVPHRIQIPEDELIQALKIIKQGQGKNGMKKKDLAKACDKEHLIDLLVNRLAHLNYD